MIAAPKLSLILAYGADGGFGSAPAGFSFAEMPIPGMRGRRASSRRRLMGVSSQLCGSALRGRAAFPPAMLPAAGGRS